MLPIVLIKAVQKAELKPRLFEHALIPQIKTQIVYFYYTWTVKFRHDRSKIGIKKAEIE
ncbi:hypothetical protein PCCS19_57260 [Paenibacillus sp. CCS19]|nr:hypothetical protein PCCS19_57260 [Paenibacillus cellulosilyticus]